jgi:hypothetical protein
MLTLRQPNDWRSHNRVEEHKDMDCTEILWLHYSYTSPPLAFLREPSSCLRSASRSLLITRGLESNSFSLYIRLFMRPLSIILGLLLCMIAVRGNELLVIKDSEAAQCVGKKVEVRGLVVSVTTSPLGTTFINFGREYPDQIFAGYIPAGPKPTASYNDEEGRGIRP